MQMPLKGGTITKLQKKKKKKKKRKRKEKKEKKARLLTPKGRRIGK